MTLHHETTLETVIERRRAEVRQDSVCHIHFGTLRQIDVLVPKAIEGKWELDRTEVAQRDPLGPTPDGSLRYRLTLAREVSDQLRLRFRFPLELGSGLVSGTPTRLTIPAIRILEGEPTSMTVRVSADPGIQLEGVGAGWNPPFENDPNLPQTSGPPLRLVRNVQGAEAIERPSLVVATALAVASLPRLVAPRLWLRTVEGPDGTLRGSAWYWVVDHESSLSVQLPEGAEWVRVRVGADAVPEIEKLSNPRSYRLRFPSRTPLGPILVVLEYLVPAGKVSADWGAPRLLGGIVQQSLWEVRLSSGRALVGVPPGWSDENEWYWDYYVWKRRPRLGQERLAAWVAGPLSHSKLALDTADELRGGYHGYLFGRPGEPSSLRPRVASRAVLVGVCSGSVLIVGLSLVLFRPPGILVGLSALGLALASAIVWDPSVTLLGVQASFVGVILTIVAACTQRFVDRRGSRHPRFAETSGSTPSASTPSAQTPLSAPEPRDESSTVVRPRAPGTTVEHVSVLPPGLGGGSPAID